jgi:predicted esterase
MKNTLAGLFLSLAILNANAEINLIPFQYGSENKTDIPTVYWPKPNAKATLIFLPGGSGSFGITKRADPQPSWVFAELYKLDKALINLVFMDSHASLQADYGDPYSRWAARRDIRHIERIKFTINYYKRKTSEPVFLFGHSNGSLSIAEFLNQSPENQHLVSGVIFSGGRNETEVKQKLAIPVMVLHHRSDPNSWTTPRSAEKLFTSIKQSNSNMTEQKWVEGGKDVPLGDPTHTGRHMYHEATLEAAELTWNFIEKVITK